MNPVEKVSEFTLADFIAECEELAIFAEHAVRLHPFKDFQHLREDRRVMAWALIGVALDMASCFDLERWQRIFAAMTEEEQQFPERLNAQRKRSIAAASDTTVFHISQLLSTFKRFQQFERKQAVQPSVE